MLSCALLRDKHRGAFGIIIQTVDFCIQPHSIFIMLIVLAFQAFHEPVNARRIDAITFRKFWRHSRCRCWMMLSADIVHYACTWNSYKCVSLQSGNLRAPRNYQTNYLIFIWNEGRRRVSGANCGDKIFADQSRQLAYACIQPPAAHTCRPTCHLPHHRKCLQKACARYRYYFINSFINFAAGIIFERA